MEKPKCPYMESGLCHRSGCIYRPSFNCMSKHEFNKRMKYVKKGKKNNERKGIKNR